MQTESIIVTRHAGLVEWLRRKGIVAKVIERACPQDVIGRRVYGVLPIRLAALASSTVTVYMPQMPQGCITSFGDMTADQMDSAGARLVEFSVSEIPYVQESAPAKTNADKLGRWNEDGFDLTGV